MELTLTAVIKALILHWGGVVVQVIINSKLGKSQTNSKCTSFPSLFACNY